MKNAKKLLALLLSAVLLAAFAGCGNSDGPSGEPAGQSSGTAKGQFESEDIKLINDLYDDEGLELISVRNVREAIREALK